MSVGVQLSPSDGLVFTIPRFQLGRGENNREHHMVTAKRVAKERGRVAWAWTELRLRGQLKIPPAPWAVLMVRCTPSSEGLDKDNNVAACKAVRDQVAAELGLPNHRDAKGNEPERASWECAQELRAQWAVRIEIRTRGLS